MIELDFTRNRMQNQRITVNCRLITKEMKMNSVHQQSGLSIHFFIALRRMRCSVVVAFLHFIQGTGEL
jgi:hypothetical protein